MCQRAVIAGLWVACLLGDVQAADAIKSGPQPKEFLPGSFEVFSVTPERVAGRFHSPLSDFGLNPGVLIFTRAEPETLAKSHPLTVLVKRLDEMAVKHPEVQFGVSVVFLNDGGYRNALEKKSDDLAKAIDFKDRQQQKIKDFGKNAGLEQAALAMDSVDGPADLKISKDADLTVIVCQRLQVTANFAYTKEQMKDQTLDNNKVILAEVNKLMPQKK